MVRNARSPLGATDNYYTFTSDYGDVTYYWRGVDVTLNARLRGGLRSRVARPGARVSGTTAQ